MKFTRYLGLTLFVGLTIIRVQAQVSKADDFFHRLFESLKANDERAYIALQLKPQLAAQVMRRTSAASTPNAANPKAKPDEKENVSDAAKTATGEAKIYTDPDAESKMLKAAVTAFRDLRTMGEKRGVRWEEAELLSYTIDSANKNSRKGEAAVGAGSIRRAKGVIDFRSGESIYQMSFDNAFNLPSEGGWFGADLKQVIRKGEERFLPDETEKQEAEQSTIATPPVPPPPPVKTKTKTTATKTKTKTKS